LARISSGAKKHWASAVFPGILGGMIRWLTLALHLAVAGLKSRRSLLLEMLALQDQLLVLSRSSKRPRLTRLRESANCNGGSIENVPWRRVFSRALDVSGKPRRNGDPVGNHFFKLPFDATTLA
jgi:hypothetical protein